MSVHPTPPQTTEVGAWARDLHGETLVVEKYYYDAVVQERDALKKELEAVKEALSEKESEVVSLETVLMKYRDE